MLTSQARQAAVLLALAIVPALVALWPAVAQPQPSEARMSRASCSIAAAERAVTASGFTARVESFWGRHFGPVDFSAWKATCGHLAGRRRDMVVVLQLEQGTGGSPKPWAIFNRTRRGSLHLSHGDLGKHLICPQSVRIHRRRLHVYRPSEYLGAYTLCDRVATYRWKRSAYVMTGVRDAFERCRNPMVVPSPLGGYGLILTGLRAAGLSCRAAGRIAARDIVGEPPGRWNCAEMYGGEMRCFHGRNWRKWLTYRFGGDAG